MPDLLRQIPNNLEPEPNVDDLLRLAAKLLKTKAIKTIPDPVSDGSVFELEPGAQYSFAVVSGNATLTRADDSTTTIFEGVVLEFVSSDVVKSITPATPGKIQIAVY